MKVAVLAGGYGTRLSEETDLRPKPMVEIGGQPILWHILKHFSAFGLDDFTIALGYKGECIKRWALDFSPADLAIDLVETGRDTNTGGRIKRLAPHLGDGAFILAYGDGVSSVDLQGMLAFHRAHGKCATVMVVRPPARFGHLSLDGDRVTQFEEKPPEAEGWINGGLFILEPAVFDYIDGDDIAFENAPMENLARDGQLMAYRHAGFWQCMDTLREKRLLESIWQNGQAPWKVW
ncbi:glucose-1-phosphate cytidylyltransferase [Yoonia tamlensis]|uniref:Glucose-1-phosphate cytidylyltransferase n=1 Tax=Yoonia tamlensis TaxID=390270 RepID=A0A1I6G9P3_9RHOB|nr:glucose-1-phosphate cytidylyltransferase [Yoonia tamlensis]SFR38870.1 glucose-1-phosphate cytidylyltransferase [Yoonia tamlensis]